MKSEGHQSSSCDLPSRKKSLPETSPNWRPYKQITWP